MTDHGHPAAGWYPDPSGGRFDRWWDGSAWAQNTRPTTATPPQRSLALTPVIPPIAQPLAALPIGAWRSPVDNRPYVRGLGDAIKIAFQRFATFDGRAGRPEFWYFALVNAIVGVGAFFLLLIPFINVIAILALTAWSLLILLPSLALTVRRLRDGGFQWAWIFLSLIPGGSIAVLVLCALPTKYV